MQTFNIATIPGDGIGPEVMGSAEAVLKTISQVHGGISFDFTEYPWNCQYYLEHGQMMPDDALDTLRPYDAILLGAVGSPTVPDHISLWGLLIPIRRGFDQYVCLRPVKLLPGVKSPLSLDNNKSIDYVVVRENTEGEYSQVGGRIHTGTPYESVSQVSIFTRHGTERIIRYAFELARQQGRSLVTSATKSNGIVHTMPFWDEIFELVASDYPDIQSEKMLVDALAAKLVLAPERFGVIVGSNLFGDILTDLGAATVGSIGIGASANINPERDYPSCFEPVHGSAPDIVGQGIANPLGQVWCSAMMLDHLGLSDAAELTENAIVGVLQAGIRTPDLGGNASTVEVTQALSEAVKRLST